MSDIESYLALRRAADEAVKTIPSVPVLDYGYVKFIESWGSDERVIESARMSTEGNFRGWGPFPCKECNSTGTVIRPYIENDAWSTSSEGIFVSCSKCKGTGKIRGDEALLERLYTKKHSTPFEKAGLTLEIQAPIMVFREWHRHRTQSYSEMSARYTPLPDFNYMPTVERCLVVSATNKQAGAVAGSDELTHASVLEWLTELEEAYAHCERTYQSGLRRGIPKELARLPVPVGRYSRMRASTDLRNWLGFLTLRMAPDAQYEIRVFANEVGKVIEQVFPRTWELYVGNK